MSAPRVLRIASAVLGRRTAPPVGASDARQPPQAGDSVWILHASCSVAATALIPPIILLGALVCPVVPPFPPWAPLIWYPVWTAGTWASAMWLGRRRLGPPPRGRLGEVRTALAALSVVLILLSRDPELVRVGFWTAGAALAAGAWADGELLAVVSLRRNLGLLRTLAVVDRHHRAACRDAWSGVTGRTP